MVDKVGRHYYEFDTSMAALLEYRTEFGESFIEILFAGKVDVEHLLRLMWCSIKENRPTYPKFIKAAARDRRFSAAALRFREAILQVAVSTTNSCSSNTDTDTINELDVLAMMAICGFSAYLVEKLPIFVIVEVISKRNEMMSTDRQSGKMRKFTNEEIKKIYG